MSNFNTYITEYCIPELLDYDKDVYKEYGIYVKPHGHSMSSRKLETLRDIAAVQKYFQCHPVSLIDQMLSIELLDSQSLMVEESWICPNIICLCTRGMGKALSLDTRIPTANGDKKMRDVHVGDYIFGDDGKPTKVILESPVYINHKCYEVTFSDGEKIIADADHIWSVIKYGKDISVTTEEISKDVKRFRRRKEPTKNGYEYIYKVKMAKPLEYKEKIFEIDPYILGLWLGDGNMSAGYITVGNDDLDAMVSNILDTGYKIKSITNDNNKNKRITISMPDGKPLLSKLRECNLYKNKHIPQEYLYSSIEQRLALIQGLMDTDGTIGKDGACSFAQSVDHISITLSLRKLLESLGLKVSLYEKMKRCNGMDFPANELYFVGDLEHPVFRLPRKVERLRTTKHIHATHKSIIEVKEVDSVPVKCLMVDNTSHLYLCGEHNTITHNTTVIDLEIMAKNLAFNNVWTYLCSGSGGQAEQSFQTLERLANDSIPTFQGSTGYIFKNEVEIKNAAGDGFSHSSGGFSYSTYNGSMTKTLNSNIDAKRGARGSVIFDECGFLSDEMINVYGAFAVVNRDLKTGKVDGKSIDPIRQRTIPQDLPYQKYYISSASSTDTKFYRMYRDFAKQQIMGNPDYCVLHIDCEQAFKPTLRGELIAPLLSRETVATEMRTNPEKARREYYCIFTTDAGNDAIIKRSYIQRNEEVRKPELANPTNDKKYLIAYDPARSNDNSFILVAEVYESSLPDGTTELKGRIVNGINLLDVGKKIKSPMRTPEQVEYLKQIILDYNGGADNYENIYGVYIDAGSGGGGVNISDYLVEDWVDKAGITHRGLIDKDYDPEITKRFPNAVNKLHLMQPTKYRSEMFEAMIEMVSQDKFSFTATYDGKDYLTVFDVDENVLNKAKSEIEAKLKKKDLSPEDYKKTFDEEMSKIETIKTKQVKLDWMDKIALANIDAMKEEMVNMVRTKTSSGRDSFNLVPEKANKLHDDRNYCMCLISYGLMQERRKSITQRKPQTPSTIEIEQLMKVTAPKRRSRF